MKVIDLYYKDSDLRCYHKNIFDTTRNYLNCFPSEYSECFNRNLDTLEIIKVDKLPDEMYTGMYNPEMNILVFSTNNSLGHEMFHMASNDTVNKQNAYSTKLDIEEGLIEGMTEYSCMKAYNLNKPGSYPFEVFTVTMLEDIPNIFRPYFIPSKRGLIDLFPNRKDIYGLLYSLNTYNKIMLDYLSNIYMDTDYLIDLTEFMSSIRYTFDNLINIELSFEKDPHKLKLYKEKFMDLLSSESVYNTISRMYPNYKKYALRKINNKIKG